jgi:hypothetical protein
MVLPCTREGFSVSATDISIDKAPRHFRAVLGRAVQLGDDAAAEQAAADLRAANLEKTIRAVVDSAPPLTETQRAKLAVLLLSGRSEAVAS